MDSGASSSFYPSDYIGEKHDLTAAPIQVGCVNKEVMTSLATDIINFNNLPLAAKKCHKFKEIWLPLLSIPQLCKSKLTVAFKEETVDISNSEGDVLITGFLDPVKDLFMVPIDDEAEQQRMTSGFAGATGQRVETEYKGIVQPIKLTTEQQNNRTTYCYQCIHHLVCTSIDIIYACMC